MCLRLLSLSELRKAYGLHQSFKLHKEFHKSVSLIGRGTHFAPTMTALQYGHMLVSRVLDESSTPSAPVPRIAITGISDIITPYGLKMIGIWISKMQQAIVAYRTTGREIQVSAFRGDIDVMMFPETRPYVWDLNTLRPLARRGKIRGNRLQLRSLQHLLSGFSDMGIIEATEYGVPSGANVPLRTLLQGNHSSFYADRDSGQSGMDLFQTELDRNIVIPSANGFLPFFPLRTFPMYMTFSNKWRIISDYAFPRDGTEVNSFVPSIGVAILKLVQFDCIFQSIANLVVKAILMRSLSIRVESGILQLPP